VLIFSDAVVAVVVAVDLAAVVVFFSVSISSFIALSK